MRFNKNTFYKIALILLLVSIFLPIKITQAKVSDQGKEICIMNDCAFIFVDDIGLQIINISNPNNPEFISHLKMEGYLCYQICAENDFVYLGLGDEIYIVDVSDPIEPFIEGTIELDVDLTSLLEIFVSSGYMYVAINNVLEIYDLNYPWNPPKIESYPFYPVKDVFVSNGIAYLACGASGLVLLNVTNPYSCSTISRFVDFDDLSITGDNAGYYIYVDGNYAYLYGTGGHDCWVIDVTDSNSMIFAGFFRTSYSSYHRQISQSIIYFTNALSFRSINVSNIDTPVNYPTYDHNAGTSGIFIENNHAYLATKEKGLLILDITNLNDLKVVSRYNIYIQSIFIRNVILIVIGSLLLIGLASIIAIRRKQLKIRLLQIKEWFERSNIPTFDESSEPIKIIEPTDTPVEEILLSQERHIITDENRMVVGQRSKLPVFFFLSIIFSCVAVSLISVLVLKMPILETYIDGVYPPDFFDGQNFFYNWSYTKSLVNDYFSLNKLSCNFGFYLFVGIICVSLILSNGILTKSYRELKILTFINWFIYVLVFIGYGIVMNKYQVVEPISIWSTRIQIISVLSFYPLALCVPLQLHLLFEKKSFKDWFNFHMKMEHTSKTTIFYKIFVVFLGLGYTLVIITPFLAFSYNMFILFCVFTSVNLLVILVYYFTKGIAIYSKKVRTEHKIAYRKIANGELELENNKAVYSLVCAIFAIPAFFIPFAGFGFFPILLISAIVLGILGLKHPYKSGYAVAGLIISGLDIIIGAVALSIILSFLYQM
ncbi:MAG: hypothetical protein ACTSPM_06605 [Candidatus Heimdallarchaeota archaeon]